MKKNLVVLSFVVMFGLMAGFTLAGENMRIEVPFAFYVDNHLFPAGEYRFDMNRDSHAIGSLVNVWAPKGADNRILMTTAGKEKDTTANQLVFNKYGQKLFLSAVAIHGYKATLKVQSLERELRSQAVQTPSIITVAQR